MIANEMTNKGLIIKIYKQFTQLNTRKTNNSITSWTEDLNRHFQGRLEKTAKSFIIREMQIKTILRHLLIPVRGAIFKKSTNNECWKGCGGKGILLHCWWEFKLIQPLWKMVWRFLKKLGIQLPCNPAIPTTLR